MSPRTTAHAIRNGCTLDCPPLCNTAHKRIALEKKCIRVALRELHRDGWDVINVHDGEERHNVTNTANILEVVFSVDESTVHLKNKATGEQSWFLVVLGNGIDCIPDHGTRLTVPMERAYDIFETYPNIT